VAIGCNPGNHGRQSDTITLSEAESTAYTARDGGFAGVSLWSANRDTDHRLSDVRGCHPYQTGEPDGAYTTAVANVLQGRK